MVSEYEKKEKSSEKEKPWSRLEKWSLGLMSIAIISGGIGFVGFSINNPYSFPPNLKNYERFARIENTIDYYENQEFPPRENDRDFFKNENSKNKGLYVITEKNIDSLSLEYVQELKQEQKEILKNDEETKKYLDRTRLSLILSKGFWGLLLFAIPGLILDKKRRKLEDNNSELGVF